MHTAVNKTCVYSREMCVCVCVFFSYELVPVVQL